jgi:hypothetical protein
MSGAAPHAPADRYGNSGRFGGDDRRADQRLRVAAVVCGVLFLGVVAWLGTSYLLRESKLNGGVPTFQVISPTAVQAHLAVQKHNGVSGVCTLRSQAADGTVVGQLDVRIPAAGSSYDTVVTIRTTGKGTTAELMGCTPDG